MDKLTVLISEVNGNLTRDSRKRLQISHNVLNLPMIARHTVGNMTSTMTYTFLGDGTRDHILKQNDYLPFGTRMPLKTQATNRYRYAGKEEQNIAGMDLSLLDFGARYYDTFVGRWNAIDPLAHKYFGMSPYNYCGNDSVNMVDSDGRDRYLFNQDGSFNCKEEEDGEDYIQWTLKDNEGHEYAIKISFVDSKNDPQNIDQNTKLYLVSEQDIQDALKKSGATDRDNYGLFRGCCYLYKESNASSLNGGKLDYTGSGDYGISPDSVLYVTTINKKEAQNMLPIMVITMEIFYGEPVRLLWACQQLSLEWVLM